MECASPLIPPSEFVFSATYDLIGRDLYYLDLDRRAEGDFVRLRSFNPMGSIAYRVYER